MFVINRETYNKYVDELLSSEEGNHLKQFNDKYVKIRSIIYIMLAIFFSGAVFCFLAKLKLIASIFILATVVALIVFIILKEKKKNSLVYLKRKLRLDLLSFLLKNNEYSFDSRGILNENIFKQSQFVDVYSEYESSDKLVINIPNDDGSKSKTSLTVCDLVVKQRKSNMNGQIEDFVVYRGIFGYVYFTNSIKGCLCVNSNYNSDDLVLNKVKTKGDAFKILSSDKDIVNNILTPTMINAINELCAKFDGIKMTFIDNKFFIGLGGNLLELGDEKDTRKDLNNLCDEIELVMKIVNEIKINHDVFVTEE